MKNCKAAMPGCAGDVMTGVPHSSVGVNERPPSSGRIQTALRDRELESFGTPRSKNTCLWMWRFWK